MSPSTDSGSDRPTPAGTGSGSDRPTPADPGHARSGPGEVGVGVGDVGDDGEVDVGDLGISRLGESLERFVGHLGAPPISVLTQLSDRWPELVGPGLSGATRPVELVNGVLVVACDDTAWASQLGWMEGQIISRFHSTFGSVRLDRVVARVGPPPSNPEIGKNPLKD